MDERLLIEGCKDNQAWAYKKLYDLYAPVMIGVCIRYVGDREVALDLLQEGFIKVFSKIDTYSGKGAFGGWIRRIFVNTSLEYLRNNHKKFSQTEVKLEHIEDTFDTLDASAIDSLSAEELLNCIIMLPKGYRTVFNLFAIEGYSHHDIAQMLKIKEVTSRTQFIRARKMLQKQVLSLKNENSTNKQGI